MNLGGSHNIHKTVFNRYWQLLFMMGIAVLMLLLICTYPHQNDRHMKMQRNLQTMDLHEAENQLDLLGSEHGDYKSAVSWFTEKREEYVPFLVQAFQNVGDLQKSRIIETLGEIQDTSTVAFLGKVFQSSEFMWNAGQALGKIGNDDAVTILIEGLNGKKTNQVKESAKALGLIKTDKSVAALKAKIDHPDPNVRYYVIQSFIMLEISNLKVVLGERLNKESDPDVKKLIERYLEREF